MERPPAPRTVTPAAQNPASGNVPDTADSDELPLVLRWAERFFSTWHYPTAAAVAALVIWNRSVIFKVLGHYRRVVFPTIVPSLRQGERDFPITALVSLFGYKSTQRRLLRITNEVLQMISPPNKLLASHPLAKIDRIVIEDPSDSAKFVSLIISYSDGSDPDAVTLGEPQLEPFMWELYNRCPHVPAFAFSSEISAVGSNADFVDLLLLRCRFEVDPAPLNVRAINRMSRDDDAVWEKFIYRAMMMALRLQKWEFLILRTINALSIPSSPRTAARVFAKIVSDGQKAMTIGNEPVMVIAWYMLKELIGKLDGPYLKQAVTEQVLQWLLAMAESPNRIGPNTVIILEDLLVNKGVRTETFEVDLRKLLEKLQHRSDPVQAFRYILSHALTDKEKEAANRQAQESHVVRVSSARDSAGLRISNFEDLPTVLSDDPSLFHTVTASHKVQRGKWYYEVTILTDGLFQIGWATEACTPNPDGDVGKGVGDDSHSFAFDGQRCLKWHNGSAKYGKHWKAEDVVGCYLDLEKREISFSLNGDDLGVAFNNVDAESGLIPAVSMQFGQMCRFNFGSRPMRYESAPQWLYLHSQAEGCVPVASRRAGLTSSMSGVPTSGISLRSSTMNLRASSTLCGICASAPANCILLPCKHGEICSQCAEKCAKCPWCRTAITSRDVLKPPMTSSPSSGSLSVLPVVPAPAAAVPAAPVPVAAEQPKS